MREIKFRGWDYSGNWVFGWLSGPDTIHFEAANQYQWTAEEVLPETIGQYTGFKDNSDQDIYEGDIIRFVIKIAGRTYQQVAKVVFEQGMFILSADDDYTLNRIRNKRVIGNIYENPELIEECQTI